jgi:NAD(P)H-hydrate epimerase
METYILNADESKKIDDISINKFKIEGIVLMENAGSKTASWIINDILKKKSSVLVVAGRGNNAGDGFVVARHLINAGYSVDVMLMTTQSKYRGDSLKNLTILKNLNCNLLKFKENKKNIIKKYDLIIDAIFGIGLSREIIGNYKEIIKEINYNSAKILSIDIPSGVNSSNGKIMGISVKADYTATYGYLKLGHLFASRYCGEIKLFDISFPKLAVDSLDSLPIKLITEDMIKDFLPVREEDSHKYQNGNLLLIGGSHGKSGAIILSAKAAFRSGVGIATAITTIGQENIVNSSLDELMVVGLLDELGINTENFTILKEFLKKKTAIVFGPGIVKQDSVFNLLTYLIRLENIPIVVDADGLNLISESGKNIFYELEDKEIVLTPHIGEFSRLVRKSVETIKENKIEIVRKYAMEHNVTLVLKGKNTIVASKNGEIYINNTGNEGMATAGSGDVLAGIIGSFMARGLNGFKSALLSVYLHGVSGDLAAKDLGKDFMNATDIINYISKAFKIIKV